LTAIAYADQLILGEIESAVAGGMESMSNAPYLLPRARRGGRLGDADVVPRRAVVDVHRTAHGRASDKVNAALRISREDQDVCAARSHQRAAAPPARQAVSLRRSSQSS
jgi:acetyl-CoA C-acetyltransferase